MALRHSLGEQLQRLVQLQAGMHMIEQQLDEYAHRGVAVQRYQRVPGVGLLTATALRAGAGPEAEHADNTSGLRGRLNDRHPLRDFHDGPGIHAHRKAEYTNAPAPLRDSKINRGTYRLTEESIYELLGTGQLHHCRSHGIPSPSPSILVFGQCRMKYFASSHERMWEQCVRPSHLKRDCGVDGACELDVGTSEVATANR